MLTKRFFFPITPLSREEREGLEIDDRMLFASLRSSAARSTAVRQVHSTAARQADVASSARQAAQGASKQLSGLAQRASALAKPLAERASSATGFNISAFADTLGYNLRVAGAVARQVYVAEALAPPRSMQVVQDAYKTMYQRAIDLNFWSNLVKSGEWKKFGVYAIEAYGIFHIGQMVSLVKQIV